MPQGSPLSLLINLFASPNEAFPAIRERSRVWLPILILITGVSIVSFVYMTSVDLPWFMDAQMQQSGAQLTDAQREQAVATAGNISPIVYGAIGAVSSSAFLMLVAFLSALYYTAVSFVTHDGIKLKQWFALVCWCLLPSALGALAQLVHVLSSDARFMLQNEINPLSFGNLMGIKPTDAPVAQRIMLGLDPTSLWSVVLTVLGYQSWTGSSFARTLAIVLGPIVCIVGISAVLTLT